MKITNLKKIFLTLSFIFSLISLPTSVFAHQPRIVENRQTNVIDPEISKAYYGKLADVPDVYTIKSDTPFDLYVGILVPDIVDQKLYVSASNILICSLYIS